MEERKGDKWLDKRKVIKEGMEWKEGGKEGATIKERKEGL